MTKTPIAYDRQTVNIIFELKRSLPMSEQADFRISSPDLIKRVKSIYLETTKADTKTLAKRVLRTIDAFSAPEKLAARYRGVVLADPSSDAGSKPSSEPKKKWVYRGLIVD